MKFFNIIFAIFLYESVFVFLFGGLLDFLNDPKSELFFIVAAISMFIALVLGITGRYFRLFKKELPNEDF